MNTLNMVLAAVGEGRIRGGWEYVWTAYGIAWVMALFEGSVAFVMIGKLLEARARSRLAAADRRITG